MKEGNYSPSNRIGLKTLRYPYETPPAEGFNPLYSELYTSHQRYIADLPFPLPS
jgi:hypothetical protein